MIRTQSQSVSIQIHGIQNITLPNDQENLIYADSGSVNVRICATPKPDIVWVNIRTGVTVLAGHSHGNYTALPLLPVSVPSGVYAKAEAVPFCYDSILVIGKVSASDNKFKVIVRSGMFMEETTIPLWVANLPRSSKAIDRFNNISYITLLCVMLTLLVIKGAL